MFVIQIAWYVVAAVLLLGVAVWAFYCGLVVRRYVVSSEKMPCGQGLCIILISDLHSSVGAKRMQKLFSKINKEKPDIIVLAGDIFCHKRPPSATEPFLAHISAIASTFFAFGNHEYRSKKTDKMRKIIKRCNITLLEDEIKDITVKGVPIRVAGVADALKTKYECKTYDFSAAMDAAFSHLDDTCINILIAHRAYYIDRYKCYPFDLVLSGHSHGGQWRIPFLINGLFVPSQGLFPKYAGGMYRHGKLVQIVSRGVSVTSVVPRIFNPPELVVVHVIGNGES